jgi:ectoine hydroxylase-related dioxygenase (phytanoyl-CoA dioxygenase family)
MSLKLYPALKGLVADKAITAAEADNAIAASAEGYSFPTNLDRDPPKGGMAPKTQQDLMRQALKENWGPEAFANEAEAQASRKLT